MKKETKFIFLLIILAVIAAILFSLNQPKGNVQLPVPGSSEIPITNNNPVASVFYSCNGGKTISVDYYKGGNVPVNPGEPPVPTGSVKIALSDGRKLDLAQTISADGARYANLDESFVFWSKGNGALVLENNQEKSYIGCVLVVHEPAGSDLSQIYSNGAQGFSIRLPQDYTVDEPYEYQLNPDKKISGVRFKISGSLSEGTNLSSDSYVSIELLPQTAECSASLFLDGDHPVAEKNENGQTYSVAQASNAGAGNRYEETVYAISGTNPCIAIRYFIHYGVIQNYPEGSVKEFDQQALLKQFDQIRSTLTVNQ